MMQGNGVFRLSRGLVADNSKAGSLVLIINNSGFVPALSKFHWGYFLVHCSE